MTISPPWLTWHPFGIIPWVESPIHTLPSVTPSPLYFSSTLFILSTHCYNLFVHLSPSLGCKFPEDTDCVYLSWYSEWPVVT